VNECVCFCLYYIVWTKCSQKYSKTWKSPTLCVCVQESHRVFRGWMFYCTRLSCVFSLWLTTIVPVFVLFLCAMSAAEFTRSNPALAHDPLMNHEHLTYQSCVWRAGIPAWRRYFNLCCFWGPTDRPHIHESVCVCVCLSVWTFPWTSALYYTLESSSRALVCLRSCSAVCVVTHTHTHTHTHRHSVTCSCCLEWNRCSYTLITHLLNSDFI